MHRKLALVGLAVTLVATTAMAADTLIPAKVGLVKTAKLAKFVSKPSGTFPLPSGPTDPSAVGADIKFFDTLGGGGSFTNLLPAPGWTGLGNPPGIKGFKFKGKALGNACSIVLIKPTVIKAVCKGSGVTLTTPFTGDDGIIIGIPAGSPTARYCADLGGTQKKNSSSGFKHSDAPAPGSCPVLVPPTATNTPANTAASTATRTSSPTPTNTQIVCPLAAPNRYTQTTTGGVLKVATFASFAFPAGGVTKQDVSAGDSNCVHQTVVPFPGGFSTPNFCVPALGATTSVTQSGCGVGEIDSNGGSDFTVNESGDTSEQTVCGVHQTLCPGAGPAPDSSGRLDITVGNGVTDVCTGGGTANAIVTIPVNTLTWVAADSSCPDSDGTFNPGTDTQLAAFPQTLDLTTDTAVAAFADLGTSPPDPDGCKKSGLGPLSYTGVGPNGANGFCQGAGVPSACCTGVNTGTCTGPTGSCLNIGGGTINVAAAGTIFSSGGPTYDLLFTTVQNSTVSGPTAFGGATCGSPPVINFTGTATRCLVGP